MKLESNNKINDLHHATLIFIFTLCATSLLMFPITNHPASTTIDRCDAVLNVWIMAWTHHAAFSDPANLFNANIFFPEPNTLAYSEHLIPTVICAIPLKFLGAGPILTHNLMHILTFPLCALGMFLLCRYLGMSRSGAWVASIVYTLAPLKFLEIARINVMSCQWIPFALLFLIKFLDSNRLQHLAAYIFLASTQILATYYHGMILGSASFVIVIMHLAKKELSWKDRQKHLIKLTFAALIIALIIAPMTFPYIELSQSKYFSRELPELSKYSADLLSYLTVSTQFGQIGPLKTGAALFPGIALLLLPGLLITAVKPKSGLLCTAFILTIVGFILSLGPELIINGHGTNIPLPAKLLWKWLPGFKAFRILWRFSILVSLGTAILAGISWSRISSNFSKKLKLTGTAIIIVALILTSGPWPVTTFTWPSSDQYPEYVTWLSNHSEVTGIAFAPYEQFQNLEEMLFSTKHWKPMINGFSGFKPPLHHRTEWVMERFPIPYGIKYLQERNISHIGFHTDKLYRFHERDIRTECAQFPELTLVAEFENTLIYSLQP